MVGSWVRPWRGERIVGMVVAVSGEELICRAPGGFEFRIRLEDLKDMEVTERKPDPRLPQRSLCGYRLTPKALVA